MGVGWTWLEISFGTAHELEVTPVELDESADVVAVGLDNENCK